MKIPTFPVHRLAKKPGIPAPLYSREHACVLATNGAALVRIAVDQADEDPECMKAGQVPPDVWAAACDQTPAKGASELRLTTTHAKLDVYDDEGIDVFQVVAPRDRTLFDEQVVTNLVGLVPARERGAKGVARVTLNAHSLALLAAALGVGASEDVHLELRVDVDGVVRKPLRVLPAELADDDSTATSPDRVGALLTRESEPWSAWIPGGDEPVVEESVFDGDGAETPQLPGLEDPAAKAKKTVRDIAKRKRVRPSAADILHERVAGEAPPAKPKGKRKSRAKA